MRYDYFCDICEFTEELERPVENRDDLALCPESHVMRRLPSMGMATIWMGRWSNPSLLKKDNDGLGSEW